MAEDIAPALLSKVQKEFRARIEKDGVTNTAMFKRARDGTLKSINQYTHKVGKALANAYLNVLTPEALPDGTLYYNIAQKVLIPTLKEAHGMVSDVADVLMENNYKRMALGLKPIRPPIQMDRVYGIIDLLTHGFYADNIHYLNEPIRNLVDHFGDLHTQRNVEFMANSGVGFMLIRMAEPTCCDWCADREGIYEDYWDAQANEAFARHEGCRCELMIKSGSTSGKMATSGHAFVRS